jgi:hypothetical protein
VLRFCGVAVLRLIRIKVKNTGSFIFPSSDLIIFIPNSPFQICEDFFQGKGLDEIFVHPRSEDFLMGLPIQAHIVMYSVIKAEKW